MAKGFVSYSGKDMRMVNRLINDLMTRSPLSIFFAPWDIAAGDSLVEKIEVALVESDFFIPLLSSNFLASDFARKELRSATQLAIDKKIIIVPVIIGKCDIPPLLADIKYIDFAKKEYDYALNELVDSLSEAKNPLRNLNSLKNFLASGEHTTDSLVALAMQVLNESWTPDDDTGRGAQFIAKKLENEGKFDEALKVYDAAVEKFPKVAPLLILRSSIHRRLGDFKNADQDCDKILQRDPNNVRALLARFWINHDWLDQEITPEEEERVRNQARVCLIKMQTNRAAKADYLHGYLHALAQGAVICDDHSFANEARQLLNDQKAKLYERRGRDRDPVLKTFKILEGFYRKDGESDIAKALEKQRTEFEDTWGRII